MNKESLNILSDAISDVGSWQWWYTAKDMFQLEFCDVQLYDATKAEKESHSSTIALRFYGNSFAVFLDNLEEDGRNWPQRFYKDEIQVIEIDTYDLVFDDIDYAKEVYENYRNRIPMKSFEDPIVFSSARHILAAKCGDYGFVAGGDDLSVVSKIGEYTEEEIINAAKHWWAYWRNYWHLRKTKDAYEKDYACEVTIPAERDNPTGNFPEED